jgi:hypothetical protein
MAQQQIFGVRTISECLADRIEQLVLQLLPFGKYGAGRRTWRVGSVAGEAGQSLCIWLDGPRRGRCRDFASGWYGDTLDLVAAVLCAGDLGEALSWARDWLGLEILSPGHAEALKRKAAATRQQRQRDAADAAIGQAHDAKRVWRAASELRPGDLVWRYLGSRGIELGDLVQPPAALRLYPALWNAESGRVLPALVAAICAPDGRHVNTHRIWLREQPNGLVTKARLERPKLSMPGGYAGGCVRLWQGISQKPWAAMPKGETLVVGEGIEDVLTIVCARPEWRAAAVLSVSSLAALVLPDRVARLIWIAQNDPHGSPAAQALAEALRVHREAGRRVSVIRPPRQWKDVSEFAEAWCDVDKAAG